MLILKGVLQRAALKQVDLAEHLGLSQAAVAQIVNHGAWPRSLDEPVLRERILGYLRQHRVPDADSSIFSEAKGERSRDALADPPDDPASPPNGDTDLNQEDSMLLRKQALAPAARKHFGLFRDPFAEGVRSHEDVFVNPDVRYVREAMFQTAKHGGLIAVVSESGGGKTTLMRDLEDRIVRENHPIIVIKPYVLAMEDNDRNGKIMKATHVAEAIMAAVAPLEKVRNSAEARFAQLHRALKDSHASGYRHCLVIDEAHALPVATLKHLKRFFELEVGFKKLLSIILIGQPELKFKLSERNQAVREVVQRCEMVELAPLDGARLDEYLRFKLDRLDKPVDEVIDASGIDALRSRLTLTGARRDRAEAVSLLYPLAIGNLMTAAMNLAADLGVPVVNGDVVKGV